MKSAGIDVGSRTVKLVIVEDGRVIGSRKQENSFDPLAVIRQLLDGAAYDAITATGYGRHLFTQHFPGQTISEIAAFARGAHYLFPACRSVLDIGGQDTKAITLDEGGRVRKFEMNDKCAAGTGRFLEIMALVLGYSLAEFGAAALSGKQAEKINNMCTVFAESEVISMISRGAEREQVALGIHQAVASRSVAMLQKIAAQDEVAFVGGVALNPAMCKLIQAALQTTIRTPDDPQIVGALGAALHGVS